MEQFTWVFTRRWWFVGGANDCSAAFRAWQARLPNLKGAVVTEVSAGGPAEKAGLQVGDRILSVNGKAVDLEQ